jgi:hypothetical protein
MENFGFYPHLRVVEKRQPNQAFLLLKHNTKTRHAYRRFREIRCVERTKQRWTPERSRQQDLELDFQDRVNELKRGEF